MILFGRLQPEVPPPERGETRLVRFEFAADFTELSLSDAGNAARSPFRCSISRTIPHTGLAPYLKKSPLSGAAESNPIAPLLSGRGPVWPQEILKLDYLRKMVTGAGNVWRYRFITRLSFGGRSVFLNTLFRFSPIRKRSAVGSKHVKIKFDE
jgi:hypothetical protein